MQQNYDNPISINYQIKTQKVFIYIYIYAYRREETIIAGS